MRSLIHLIPPYIKMLTHWINEMMNLFAGHSRYVHYNRLSQLGFVMLVLLFGAITLALILFV